MGADEPLGPAACASRKRDASMVLATLQETAAMLVESTSRALKAARQPAFDALNKKLVTESLARIRFNQFGFFDRDDNMYGGGLFLRSAMLNHSCAPNIGRTLVVGSPRTHRFVAMYAIPAGECDAD